MGAEITYRLKCYTAPTYEELLDDYGGKLLLFCIVAVSTVQEVSKTI